MQELSSRYPVWLCDVWGVVHDGVVAFAPACDSLRRHRTGAGTVLLVTNAPRRAAGVASQLDHLGVPPDAYDGIVTSGDVTRSLIVAHGKGAVHHIGPSRDLGIFEGLDVALVPPETAHAVVCTGLHDDTVETPDDYREALARMRELNLPMICANPDKIVRRGSDIVYCAGALAERYEQHGGRVLMAGKPFQPIYELALATAAEIRRSPVQKRDVLAIGDGPETDIAGAALFGIDCALITGGISDAALSPAAIEREVRLKVPLANIVKVQQDLHW
jgi:HAD superfamily hydrolase (TIGR01459 family)